MRAGEQIRRWRYPRRSGVSAPSGPGVTTDPNLISIAADGWSGVYTNPPVANFDPATDPKSVVVNRIGYDATANVINFDDVLTIPGRIREPHPISAFTNPVFTPDRVAVSNFIHSGEIIRGGATNNSTLLPLNPALMWTVPTNGIADSVNVYRVGIAADHAFGRNGTPLACVEFTASDEHGNSVSSGKISTLVAVLHPESGMYSNQYIWDIPLASLDALDTITVNFKPYQHVGTNIFDTAILGEAFPSASISPLQFFNNKSGTQTRWIAYVDNVGGGTPQASTDDAAAAANPFQYIDEAARAAYTANGDSYSGLIINITATTVTANGNWTNANRVPKCPMIIQAAGGAAARDTTFVTSIKHTTTYIKRSIWRNITLLHPAVGNFFTNFTSTPAEPAITIMDNCRWDDNGNASTYGAFWYSTGVTVHYNGSVAPGSGEMKQTTPFSTTHKSSLVIGCNGVGFGQSNVANIVGSCVPDSQLIAPNQAVAGNQEALKGRFVGFNKLTNTQNLGSCCDISGYRLGDVSFPGTSVAMNSLERTHVSAGVCLWVSADGDLHPTRNVMINHNTANGDRFNTIYHEPAAISGDGLKTQNQMGANATESINMKTDLFFAPGVGRDGTRIGNWSWCYRVACNHNTYRSGSVSNQDPNAGVWNGEVAELNTAFGTDAAPLAYDWTDDQSADGAGGGNGNYRPLSKGPLVYVPFKDMHYTFDLEGKPIPTDGSAVNGAIQL